jgi:hypothetical protein
MPTRRSISAGARLTSRSVVGSANLVAVAVDDVVERQVADRERVAAGAAARRGEQRRMAPEHAAQALLGRELLEREGADRSLFLP